MLKKRLKGNYEFSPLNFPPSTTLLNQSRITVSLSSVPSCRAYGHCWHVMLGVVQENYFVVVAKHIAVPNMITKFIPPP